MNHNWLHVGADWLSGTHSVSMPGWAWLLCVPVVSVVLVAGGGLLFYAAFLRSLRNLF